MNTVIKKIRAPHILEGQFTNVLKNMYLKTGTGATVILYYKSAITLLLSLHRSVKVPTLCYI